jgi:hypothetical protein
VLDQALGLFHAFVGGLLIALFNLLFFDLVPRLWVFFAKIL